jgi:hypothetical protein
MRGGASLSVSGESEEDVNLPVPPIVNQGEKSSLPQVRPADTPGGISTDNQNMHTYISTSPTCSLNLVCYRSRARGCKLGQIQTIAKSRFQDEAAFQKALTERPTLISSDLEFFQNLRKEYLGYMCGFWRRFFFLKTLCGFRLLQVGE